MNKEQVTYTKDEVKQMLDRHAAMVQAFAKAQTNVESWLEFQHGLRNGLLAGIITGSLIGLAGGYVLWGLVLR